VSGTGGSAGAITGLASYDSAFNAGHDVDAPIGTSTPGTLTINSLRFNNAGAYTLSGTGSDTLTIASGGILETSTVGANNTVTISAATLTSGNGQDLVVHHYNAAALPRR
jgi:hypothetical protein